MKKLNIDLTSFSSSINTFLDLFQIHDRQELIDEYLIGRKREDVSVESFIDFARITVNPLEYADASLTSLHVTTNNDSCKSILEQGLMDLQKAVVVETPLKIFLESYGIKFSPDQFKLRVNETVIKLSLQPTDSSANEKDALLNRVSVKMYEEYPIWGFVCSDNVLGYGGYVNRRPEFLNNLSNLLNKPGLVKDWEDSTETFILKFSLPLAHYDDPTSIEYLGDLIVKTVFDYINYGSPCVDVYSMVKHGEQVRQEEIIAHYTVTEFEQYLNS